MKIVIPLAGLGKRLRPHTYSHPKPLINVAGKPVLGHILDGFKGLDVEEIIFIVGYLGDQIKAYVDAHYDFKARYVEQKELLGQAHAIYLAKDYITGPTLIAFVDTIFEANLAALGDLQADGVLYVKEVEDPRRFGVAVVKDGYIARLIEKPSDMSNRLVVIGVYYVKDGPGFIDCTAELIRRGVKNKGEYYIADALQLMIDRGAKLVAEPVEVWEDCGQRETVLHTNRFLLERSGGQAAPTTNSVLIPPVYIAPSAKVENSVVGPYVTVADGAVVRHAIITDSVINEGAVVEKAMLTGSLIGSEAHVRRAFEQLNVGDSSVVDLTGNGE
ncbi:MAG: NTP transferase domain-containing protein [Chloroflexi bacterium]|nr:NTP transferase domain-containing protein [Chloroflexota bacterium]